ncbi:hydroxymethylglutaryl-CoA reductase [uncultured Roseibium sp.]|uniref:hydroxymethylglutaryl-CoA reductase n=1 Tax=uncultured Roseibium sp. TaxID=1936171 RepID=UPI0026109A1A|nr:hydroxymethylglutaryl-CoA reductase [uncultured Roseibium sp.]
MTLPRPSGSAIARIWSRLTQAGVPEAARKVLADDRTLSDVNHYAGNIENMVGTVKVPVGVIGPLRVNGVFAQDDYFVPLATTEAALVASYARGAKAVGKSGGISVATLGEGVLRSPAFRFDSIAKAGLFVDWAITSADGLVAAAEATTRFGKLLSIDPVIDGEIVFLMCRYETGDAAGQNMVTFATEALCRHALQSSPVAPKSWFLEANFSGDKKASFLGTMLGRGRRVTAQVDVPEDVAETVLGSPIDQILEYGRIANLGALMTGQVGAQAHFANGLAALYLATGQDVACVAESAVGFTRMERSETGLLVTVTLPNLILGTVGGGTQLPSQAAGLDILGLRGTGKAPALAEVAAALCLCGELSLTAAVAGGQFGSAHKRLARGKNA